SYWSKTQDIIYFTTTDKTYNNLYAYDLSNKSFSLIKSGEDLVRNISFSSISNIAAYIGVGQASREKAYIMNLEDYTYSVVSDPEKENFEDVVFGNHEDWVYTTSEGTEIDGRVYYPPNFDASKKYPLIVNYYAGTSPVNRSFRGRYPLNFYAALGYVVYVLQPSGTFGYGQDYSAAHVNNWGITVADEIIEASTQFLEEHPFINKDKVGCTGASYGGFMTMLLSTRTNMFAAAISHAGISSISSYWGEGYWGYAYSAAATALSFPWNNHKVYVDQSPLFHADKINTPLLLLHGNSDTNVPPGESYQLYTALKILGRPVEMIEIKGQNHHILDYKKRIKWQKTIHAWFDKYLKDQPEWWDDIYPENNL
ncbi:MAG: S9 family peptidase, partial [Bacteroidales bacterium]|nr:S9 family peptidase [Bacteroidales bacterium]